MSDSLSPLQHDALRQSNLTLESIGYFLAGGTALSIGYLHHRFSEDLDFFCASDRNAIQDATLLASHLSQTGIEVEYLRREPNLCRLKLTRMGESTLLDLVTQEGVSLRPHESYESVPIASLQDLAVNKVLALNREEAKDFVDLYLILKTGPWSLGDLLEMAKVKSADFEDDWALLEIAGLLANVHQIPHFSRLRLIKPISKDEIATYFKQESDKLYESLRPSAD
jgi:hypothetical protein